MEYPMGYHMESCGISIPYEILWNIICIPMEYAVEYPLEYPMEYPMESYIISYVISCGISYGILWDI